MWKIFKMLEFFFKNNFFDNNFCLPPQKTEKTDTHLWLFHVYFLRSKLKILFILAAQSRKLLLFSYECWKTAPGHKKGYV